VVRWLEQHRQAVARDHRVMAGYQHFFARGDQVQPTDLPITSAM
jgi:hypothetical protein